MRQCGLWFLSLISLSNFQLSHQAEVAPLSLNQEWLEQLVADSAHTSDFVHEFMPHGWWWCTLVNFFDELGEYNPGLQAFFASKGSEKGNPELGVAPESLLFANRNFANLVNFMKFETGIVSTDGRSPKSMFHWAREVYADPEHDVEAQIPVPEDRKFRQLFRVIENVNIDKRGLQILADSKDKADDSSQFVKWFNGVIRKHCRAPASPASRYLPHVTPCLFPKYLDLIDDDYVPAQQDCASDPAYMDPDLDFVKHMVGWFASIRAEHNKFKYHDDLHGMFFSMAVPLFMESYSTEEQRALLEPAHYMAGAMAGLYHDVGYLLIDKLKKHEAHGAVMDKAAGYDDAHELVSLMAALWKYDESPHPTCGALCRKIIAVVILATKIVKSPFPPLPVKLSLIQKFLHTSDETRSPEMFSHPDYPVTQADANGATLADDSKTARTRLLVKCVQTLYHSGKQAMIDQAVCAPFVDVLSRLGQDAVDEDEQSDELDDEVPVRPPPAPLRRVESDARLNVLAADSDDE